VRNRFPSSFDRDRPKLSVRSRRWAVLGGVICSLIIFPSLFLAVYLPSFLCPPSTFHWGGLVGSGLGLPHAILLGLPSLLVLFVSIGTNLNAWSYSNYPSRQSSGKYATGLIALSTFGVLAAAAMLINSASFYFCATPSNVIIRSGYLDTPRSFAWGDVKGVHAWCWTANPRNGTPYQGATLKLSFSDGEEIPFGLVDGGRILMNDYKMIRQSLKNKNYSYDTDSSVAADSCPPALYPLLSNWQTG
jgi:hypothetical protein